MEELFLAVCFDADYTNTCKYA